MEDLVEILAQTLATDRVLSQIVWSVVHEEKYHDT
jgi:hypothetical protein